MAIPTNVSNFYSVMLSSGKNITFFLNFSDTSKFSLYFTSEPWREMTKTLIYKNFSEERK